MLTSTRSSQEAPAPHATLGSGWEGDPKLGAVRVAGPGGNYPKGFRSGAPFQTGQNWPLSWELRAFEARQRPGVIPEVSTNGSSVSDETPASSSNGAAPDGELTLYTGRLIYDSGTMISQYGGT